MASEEDPLLPRRRHTASAAAAATAGAAAPAVGEVRRLAALAILVGGIYTFSAIGTLSVIFMLPKLKVQPAGGFTKEEVTWCQSLFFVGAAVSCLLVLPLSDRVGRKFPMYSLVACMLLAAVAACTARTSRAYGLSVFALGATECPAVLLAYVLVQESLHESLRGLATVALNVSLGFAIMAMTMSCKFLTAGWSWQTERLLWYSPFVLFLTLGPFLVSDSPQFARCSKVEEDRPPAARVTEGMGRAEVYASAVQGRAPLLGRTAWRLLHPDFRGMLAATALTWVACSVSYYGLSYAAGELSADVYMNVALMALVDICGYGIPALLLSRLDAPSTQVLAFAMLALSLFICSWLPQGASSTVALALAGRLSADISFTTSYILLVDCFPAECRSTASGVANFFARMSTLFTPLAAVNPHRLTCLILAALSVLASLATFASLRGVRSTQRDVEGEQS